MCKLFIAQKRVTFFLADSVNKPVEQFHALAAFPLGAKHAEPVPLEAKW